MENQIVDLVDEMQWEDIIEFVSLEDAGLELREDDSIMGQLWFHYYRIEN